MDNINETTMMTVISVLGEKVQTLRAEMATESANHQNRVYDMEDEIHILKSKNKDLNDQLSHLASDLAYYRKSEGELRERTIKAETELRLLKANDPNTKEKAKAYMVEKGQFNVYKAEDMKMHAYPVSVGAIKHIDNIKEVRNLTAWGLKETKDFCEEWMLSNGFHHDQKDHVWVKTPVPIPVPQQEPVQSLSSGAPYR